MDFSFFKTVVFEAARALQAVVTELHEPDVTPNFASACIQVPTRRVYVIQSEAGDWAFSSTHNPSDCRLEFTDWDELADALQSRFNIRVLSAADLKGPFRKREWMHDTDIKYWKPETLGQALFNWWD